MIVKKSFFDKTFRKKDTKNQKKNKKNIKRHFV